MAAPIRMTTTTRAVLHALAETAGETTGLAIQHATGLKSGTVYPILARLAANDLAIARWESEQEWTDGGMDRPRRKYYTLTPAGRALAGDRPAASARSAGIDGALADRFAAQLLREFAKDPRAHQVTELGGYLPELTALDLPDSEYDKLADAIYQACERAVITIPEED